ncbi:hypothetical protein LCGC14_1263490 [marine sediment metagenome]|jgi:hypothetical protein|uniref:ISXO2-like transposase domain-containing protein n=1 Tax=marine sediment metagenome TaxID=412755 RepID=A0A0F9L2C9_9ZZZZ
MKTSVPYDAALCFDWASGYSKVAAQLGVEHFVVGCKPRTRVAAGSRHIQNVNSLHVRYLKFRRTFCGPSTNNLDSYNRWLEVRLAPMTPKELVWHRNTHMVLQWLYEWQLRAQIDRCGMLSQRRLMHGQQQDK